MNDPCNLSQEQQEGIRSGADRGALNRQLSRQLTTHCFGLERHRRGGRTTCGPVARREDQPGGVVLGGPRPAAMPRNIRTRLRGWCFWLPANNRRRQRRIRRTTPGRRRGLQHANPGGICRKLGPSGWLSRPIRSRRKRIRVVRDDRVRSRGCDVGSRSAARPAGDILGIEHRGCIQNAAPHR